MILSTWTCFCRIRSFNRLSHLIFFLKWSESHTIRAQVRSVEDCSWINKFLKLKKEKGVGCGRRSQGINFPDGTLQVTRSSSDSERKGGANINFLPGKSLLSAPRVIFFFLFIFGLSCWRFAVHRPVLLFDHLIQQQQQQQEQKRTSLLL